MVAAMTMATSAFAQAVFTASSSRVGARMNGQTELTGGITLFVSSGTLGAGDEGTVTIDYGTTITNALTTGIAVNICGETGTGGATGNTAISGSAITITVDGDAGDGCQATESINVSGVRVAIAGTDLSEVAASISSSGDVRLGAGTNEVPVINRVSDELVDGGVTAQKITLIRHTADEQARSATDDGTTFKLMIEENVANAFNNGVQLNLDFSGIGAGMTITIDAWAETKANLGTPRFMVDTGTLILNDCGQGTDNDEPTGVPAVDDTRDCNADNKQLAFSGGMNTDTLAVTLDSMNTEAVVLTGFGTALNAFDTDPTTDGIQLRDTTITDTGGDGIENDITGAVFSDTEIDVIIVSGTISVSTRGPGSASLPLGDVNVAATVDVGPTGPAVYGRFHTGGRPIPRFASDPTSAVTVIDVTSDQTMLRVPYAVATGDLWDTGIAIANTRTGGAAQFGAITFDFYGGDVEIDSYTTMAGSPGNGLNDDGMLEAGGTYSVLLSAVLEAAGHDGDFTGYVEVTTDFTEAEAYVFIASFVGGAWGASGTAECIDGCGP